MEIPWQLCPPIFAGISGHQVCTSLQPFQARSHHWLLAKRDLGPLPVSRMADPIRSCERELKLSPLAMRHCLEQ